MRVLQIIPSVSLVYGGPSQMIRGLSDAIARQDATVDILTTNSNGDTGQPPLDVPLNQPIPEGNYTIRYFACSPFRRYKFSLGLLWWLWQNAHHYDVAHIHALFSPVSTLAATIARWRQLPYILRPLGTLDPADLRKKRRLKQIYGYSFARPNLAGALGVHFTSEQEARVSERYRTHAHTIILPLGVDIPTLPPFGRARQRWQITETEPILLYMSRIDRKKGIELLLTALARLQQQNVPCHFVLAGSNVQDPAYEQKIAQLVQSQLGDRATVTGFVTGTEKLALLRDADLFVLPSYYENFGIAVAEAMAAQLPVVISDQVHIWDVIAQAEAGWVVPCEAEPLAEALAIALSNPDTRKHRGQKAQALVRERYSWDAIATQLLRTYQNLLTALPTRIQP
jgi:glycosyltransferase involved in cell wall biosynthesis